MKRFQEGYVVGGRYVLETFIASGGMGDVWRARDDVLGRTVAVKIMRPEPSSEPVFAQRFHEEALLTAGLSHHNIATLFDYGAHDNIAYLVMEFVEGEPLSVAIRERGAFEPDLVRSIVGQMAMALHTAHEAGVVHRDVKPANVLLTSDGVVKLTDFGIARATDRSGMTRTGEMLGTPHYLSPEQALGRTATAASDLYALGVVAHELLTGRRPFDLDTPVATALAHITDPMPTLPSAVPTDILDVVTRCLAKEPGDRPLSARDIAVSLGIPQLEVNVPPKPAQGVTPAGERVSVGREAKLIDAMMPARGRVLVAGVGDGRVARDLASLGYRVVGVDPSEENLAEAADVQSGVGWVPSRFEEISLERIGETAPFDVACWIDAPLEHLDEGVGAHIVGRLSSCLGPTGRVLISYSVGEASGYQGFRDEFLAVGLVPDVVFRSWDLRPQTVEATTAIMLLSRR